MLVVARLAESWLLLGSEVASELGGLVKRQGVTQKVKRCSLAGVRFLQVCPRSIPNVVGGLLTDSDCPPGPCTLDV